MKKVSLPVFTLLCFITSFVKAQAPFGTIDSIAINNIHAKALVHGDMWWDSSRGSAFNLMHLDTLYRVNIESAGALWLSGYDGSGQLHLAAQTYRDMTSGYWPGPLDASDTLTYATSENWAKIWKVSRIDIQYFLSLTTHTTTNTPLPVLTWPAKGNIYAQGNAGAPLTVTSDMAPFVDLNSNGIYEPLLGEYPDIKGDQALWWVFSDNGPTHCLPGVRPLGVEIHAMSYAYNRGTLIDNVIYYEYNIVNRSSNSYSNCRIAQWNDPNFGYYLDDFIGFDSVWRMGICYNGTNDLGGSGGHPVIGYHVNPPITAVTMIVLPGDVGTTYVPAGSFTYYNNDGSVIGNPLVDTEYDNYIRSKIRNGLHITDDFVGPGVPTKGFGLGPDCNYVFSGDPSDNSQWSECACNNNPSDRRSILASNDFALGSGGSQKIVFALIVADTLSGGCPVAKFEGIRIVADTAWKIYHNPLPPLPPSRIENVATSNSIKIYPNPAHDKLIIENTGNTFGDGNVTISNIIGQTTNVNFNKNGQMLEVNISNLLPGMYIVVYRAGEILTIAKFLKE